MDRQETMNGIQAHLTEKHARLLDMRKDLMEGTAQDTKSSMGDKYETSREMAKQELQKIESQISILEQQQRLFSRIRTSGSSEVITAGSVIESSEGTYFLGIALGLVRIQQHTVFCLSPQSPLGKVLTGKQQGETITFRGRQIQLLNIW